MDVAGDGDGDLVAASKPTIDTVRIELFQSTAAGYEAPVVHHEDSPETRLNLTAADLDGDGDDDLVVQYTIDFSTEQKNVLWLRNDAD